MEAFFAEVLVHTKGIWARRAFALRPWQRDELIRPVFGWVVFDTQWDCYVRLYQDVWYEVARGNGKSEIDAGMALYLTMGDDEESAEVYGAAKNRPQARKVWDVGYRMVQLSPVLNPMWRRGEIKVNIQEKRIVYERTASYYQIVTKDAAAELGANPHGIVFDEVLAQQGDALWEALRTGSGKRIQSLMFGTTTAGNDPSGFAHGEHKVCERIAEDPSLSPRRFVFMRNLPDKADPFTERNWKIPNPALGDFLSISTLRKEAAEAKLDPVKEESFRQYRLNQWRHGLVKWMPLARWDETAGMVLEEDLEGEGCFGGIDLASSIDIAALCWDFPDEEGAHDAIWRFWIPQARIADLTKRTGGQARIWVRDGFLEVTEGDVIDYKAIERQVDEDATRFNVQSVAFDPWGMTQLSQILEDLGLELYPMRQGFQSMSPPMKAWQGFIYEQKYRHGGNPVMRWMVGNVVVRTDPAGNIKIDREKSSDKVDGAIAGVMALDAAMRDEGAPSITIIEPNEGRV